MPDFVKVSDLAALLAEQDQNALVLLSKDSEGNRISGMAARLQTWTPEDVAANNEELPHYVHVPTGQPAICFYPML